MRRFVRMVPVSRATAVWWAWRNRHELGRWAGFAWRALTPGGESREDVVTEARLRAALARDERTRGLPTLSVRVAGATAALEGRLSSPAHDLVYSIAERTRGIDAIECRIQDRRASGPARAHVHTERGSVPRRADLPS